MNYGIFSEHLHYLYTISSTLLLPAYPAYFLYAKAVSEKRSMKCEPTRNNKNVHTFEAFTSCPSP